jgi:predicted nuclease of predicted toxin-antitoxin system
MRFLADMGVDIRVVEWLRKQGHEAIHLRDEGLQRLPDPEIFAKAGAENRIILTFDLDFGEILALSAGATISVILFRLHNARTPHVIARLETVLNSDADALTRGAIIVVEDARHRVRILPLTPSTGSQDSSRQAP